MKKIKERTVKTKRESSKRESSKKKSQSFQAPPLIQWGQNVWPIERDVLFRPDRYKYIRKIVRTKGCVFCQAANKKPSLKTLCVFQSELSMVLLNKFPYNSGHLLILPRRHCGDLLNLTKDEFEDLHWTLNSSIKVLNQAYSPSGMNVGLNLGQAAGAGIPEHIHYHLVPRWSGDLNFFPLIAETKVVIETLAQSYKRIVSCY